MNVAKGYLCSSSIQLELRVLAENIYHSIATDTSLLLLLLELCIDLPKTKGPVTRVPHKPTYEERISFFGTC